MDIYEVVTKLIGPIDPVGESNADEKRLKNLNVMTNLVDKLMQDISFVTGGIDSYQHSVKIAGQLAHQHIVGVLDDYDDHRGVGQ